MSTRAKLTPVRLPRPHIKQRAIAQSRAKFKIINAGRRGGKTIFGGRAAAKGMTAGKIVLIGSPSQKQVDAFWKYIKTWFFKAIQNGKVIKNEQRRTLIFPDGSGKTGSIECRTARFADELRGGYGDLIILDEAVLLDKDALDEVIMPMLWDNDGDLWILSTPKAGSWFNELCNEVIQGKLPEWEYFHFTSLDNPHISQAAVARGKAKMTARAWEEEGLAKLLDEVKGALWKRAWIRRSKVTADDCSRIVVAIDPAVSTNKLSSETGIIVAGELAPSKDPAVEIPGKYAVLEDLSGVYTPKEWAKVAHDAFNRWRADYVLGERNNGGDLVAENLKNLYPNLPVGLVWASKGKFARAEPVAGLYEPGENKDKGQVTHAGVFDNLETQLVTWTIEADWSPDRLDALVWALSELSGVAPWSESDFDMFD